MLEAQAEEMSLLCGEGQGRHTALSASEIISTDLYIRSRWDTIQKIGCQITVMSNVS